MKKLLLSAILFAGLLTNANAFFGGEKKDYSNQGASPLTAKEFLDVKTNSKNLTLEQQNIVDSYNVENKPGTVKHLYIISPFNGKVILYSTVMGKVTDNAKGLTPSKTIGAYSGSSSGTEYSYITTEYKGKKIRTNEIPNPSGTYGTSSPYIYWFDVKGQYHKHYRGMSEIHISDKPIPIRDGSLSIEFK